MNRIFTLLLKLTRLIPYKMLDKFYLSLDKPQILRTRNLQLIPSEANRRGGKYSYAEWAHVIGIFQTLFYQHLDHKESNAILDVGCGTGLLGIAAGPFIQDGGKFVGIDVMKKDIDFCKKHYSPENHEFIHFDLNNPFYTPTQETQHQPWPLENDTFNMVTALSVWTHLNEADSIFYLQEVNRVLKPGGKAIITFFILDETYRQSLKKRRQEIGRFHGTEQIKWIFDKSAYDSEDWFCPDWVEIPENAIGVTENGLEKMVSKSGLILQNHFQGNWKEIPGLFFQDVIIFKKK